MMDRDVLKINTLFLRDAKRYRGVSLAKHVQPRAGLKCCRNPVKTILWGSISGLRDQKVSEQSADAVGKAWYSSSPGPCWILGLISPCVREASSPEQGSVNLQAGSGSCVGVLARNYETNTAKSSMWSFGPSRILSFNPFRNSLYCTVMVVHVGICVALVVYPCVFFTHPGEI